MRILPSLVALTARKELWLRSHNSSANPATTSYDKPAKLTIETAAAESQPSAKVNSLSCFNVEVLLIFALMVNLLVKRYCQ
jgi:hypothetical protein